MENKKENARKAVATMVKNTPVTVATVERVSDEITKVTAFKTLEQASNIINSLNIKNNENRYKVGAVLNAIQERKLLKTSKELGEWAESHGIKTSTAYALAKIAKNFKLEDMQKYGFGVLNMIKSRPILLNSVKPEMKQAEVKKLVDNAKEQEQKEKELEEIKKYAKQETNKTDDAIQDEIRENAEMIAEVLSIVGTVSGLQKKVSDLGKKYKTGQLLSLVVALNNTVKTGEKVMNELGKLEKLENGKREIYGN